MMVARVLQPENADDWQIQLLRKDRIEFRDSTRPRVEVISSDTVDH